MEHYRTWVIEYCGFIGTSSYYSIPLLATSSIEGINLSRGKVTYILIDL